MGLDPAAVPATVAELDCYYQRATPGLYACDEAREALRGSSARRCLPSTPRCG